MCGISGILSYGGSDRAELPHILDRMVDAMRTRGPDGRGTWWSADGRVGLGHRRLAIIDLSELGHQPMSNEDGTVWITFNGEIYNYRELRRELEAKGHTFRSHTDTECIVHLYEELGQNVVHRLDGDFAFCIWDVRRQEMFLARDPLGVKPLYYGHVGKDFVFASELNAILEHPHLEKRLDETALYHYLTYLAVPAPFSLAKGISKLNAGECVLVNPDGGVVRRRYWEPLPRRLDIAETDRDDRLRELFDRAVEKRTLSDVPVGVLFSGGVDSTLNALSFGELSAPATVHGFTAGMQADRYENEADFAGQVARLLGLDWHHVELTEPRLREMMGPEGALTAAQDEPLADPVCAPLYLVTQLARQRGVVVLQAGEGADETLCGYDGYRTWMQRHATLWRPLSVLPRAVASMGYQVLKRSSRPFDRKMADVLLRRSKGREFFVSEAVGFYETEKPFILDKGYLTRMAGVDSYDIVEPYYARIRRECPEADFLQTLTYLELSVRLPELLLMRADKIAMANSIELRVPFLDRELVEFALSMPPDFKLRDGISKEPYKRMATRKLENRIGSALPTSLGSAPKDVFYRRKRGFGAPLQDWFESGLGNDMRDLVAANRADVDHLFNVKEILAALDRGMVTVNQSFQMWVLYCFLCWKYRNGF